MALQDSQSADNRVPTTEDVPHLCGFDVELYRIIDPEENLLRKQYTDIPQEHWAEGSASFPDAETFVEFLERHELQPDTVT